MRTRIPFTLIVVGWFVGTVFFSACRPRTAEQAAAALPELPADVAATLDPATMGTKVVSAIPDPEKAPGTAAAPCCSSTDQKSLKVNFPYTKCGPLHDLVVAPIENAVFFQSNRDNTRIHKLSELNGKRLADLHICRTSQGPWNATLIETRPCQNYTPKYTLIIDAFGDLVTFNWNGSVQNHPPQVQLVSCRQVSTTRFVCGISSCDCPSSTCPATASCECNLQW